MKQLSLTVWLVTAACGGSDKSPVDMATDGASDGRPDGGDVTVPGAGGTADAGVVADGANTGVTCPNLGALSPPKVPANLEVPIGHKLTTRYYAEGAQVYTCRIPAGSPPTAAFAWVLKAPDAKLFDAACTVVGPHFGGPTWASDRDKSAVVGAKVDEAPSPRGAASAIPWLLLKSASTSGTGVFGGVSFIHRTDTVGGVAPATGCDVASAGKELAVPYTAIYYFYKPGDAADGGGSDAVGGSDAGGGGDAAGDAGAVVAKAFTGTLNGAQEIPTPIATTATGTISLTLNAARTEVSFMLTHTVADANAAHIHRGVAGENGPIVFPLTGTSGKFAVTPEQAADLEAGRYYANVHSPKNPMGEIRGQILLPGETLWVGKLTGAQEVPPIATTATGFGQVMLSAAKTNIRYLLVTTAIPTIAHIHKAPGGSSGGIELPIAPVGATMVGSAAVTAAQAAALEGGDLYFNIHTAANAAGEIRGQILRAAEVLYTAVLSGASEVPPVTTMAKGGVSLILNAAGTILTYEGAVTGMTPTAGHLHNAVVGMNGPVVFPLELMGANTAGKIAVTAEGLTALNAGAIYANFHSALFADGEIRGQVTKQ